MVPKNKKILFFCPHPDDEAISSAALIHNMINTNNNEVICVFLRCSANGVDGSMTVEDKQKIRKQEAISCCKVLGCNHIFLNMDDSPLEADEKTIPIISDLIKKEKPDIIFLPPDYDAHPTHKKTNQIITNAFGSPESNMEVEKWYYETWTPITKPNYIFFFDDKLMDIKKKAISSYSSQLKRTDFLNSAIALNTFRGITGKELLEGFGSSGSKGKYGEAFYIEK